MQEIRYPDAYRVEDEEPPPPDVAYAEDARLQVEEDGAYAAEDAQLVREPPGHARYGQQTDQGDEVTHRGETVEESV